MKKQLEIIIKNIGNVLAEKIISSTEKTQINELNKEVEKLIKAKNYLTGLIEKYKLKEDK